MSATKLPNPNNIKSVTVYCGGSDLVGDIYLQEAATLGEALAKREIRLVYGGGSTGLMGCLAHSVKKHGGYVTGIIPEFLDDLEVRNKDVDTSVICKTMRERKDEMERLADAFIALPGGFGTMEEVLEVITNRQLDLHSKPIVFVSTNGYYYDLISMLQQSVASGFATKNSLDCFHVVADAAEAVEYIATCPPLKKIDKFKHDRKDYDIEIFGDQLVYCSQHLAFHTSGWCSVEPQFKLGLGIKRSDPDAAAKATVKCRSMGLSLYEIKGA